jgi:N-acetylneuraminic acid mutarotase
MTDQRELDRLLGAFFVEGTDELADRVIDAALDQIDHTRQRRAVRMPRRFSTMNMLTRLAAAAVIGVLAVGGTLYLVQRGQPAVGGPSPTPGVSSSPSQPAVGSPSPTPGASSSPGNPASPSAGAPAWTATGGMIEDGFQDTATLLPDGKVLVAGGTVGTGLLASAELYDPGNGSWTATGSMPTPRQFHTATLLPDGKVLVAGGTGSNNTTGSNSALASAELYDPGNGSWTATGSMVAPRMFHTATLLPDGKVLVAGGTAVPGGDTGGGKPPLASAELYDPKSGSWTATGSMPTPRQFHTATLLPDGKVLVAGGSGSNSASLKPPLASAALYDPGSGSWTATGNMVTPRSDFTATLLPDGKVLVAGGLHSGVQAAAAELYDPGNGSWSATGSMVTPRADQTATLLPDGKVLVAGGSGSNGALASAERYDPGSGSWTAAGSMVTPRQSHTATLLPDGKVLVAGGFGAEAPVVTAELYDPGSGTR